MQRVFNWLMWSVNAEAPTFENSKCNFVANDKAEEYFINL